MQQILLGPEPSSPPGLRALNTEMSDVGIRLWFVRGLDPDTPYFLGQHCVPSAKSISLGIVTSAIVEVVRQMWTSLRLSKVGRPFGD